MPFLVVLPSMCLVGIWFATCLISSIITYFMLFLFSGLSESVMVLISIDFHFYIGSSSG